MDESWTDEPCTDPPGSGSLTSSGPGRWGGYCRYMEMATQQNRKLEMLFTQRSKVVKDRMALRLNIMRQMEVDCGNFDISLDHFPRISRPCTTPHAPGDMP